MCLTAHACHIAKPCERRPFLDELKSSVPIELPGTTPVYSRAAFQLLAFAIESNYARPFATVLEERILRPLRMNSTSLLHNSTDVLGYGLRNESLEGEPAALGLISSITDLSRFGRAILMSHFMSPADTRRWLKPVSDTSNLRDSVGRPWDIYHFGDTVTDPIVDIYTYTGSVGKYSSYFGIAPAYDIGFVILAVDTDTAAPDLNAYADVVLGALLQINKLARVEANQTLAGTYHTPNQAGSNLRLELTGSDPGLAISEFNMNGTDWVAYIARQAGISKSAYLDLRIYPTNLERQIGGHGKQQVFQGVIQDKSPLVDAGTPTCIFWMTIGELERDGQPLDGFVVDFDRHGIATAITWPALGVRFERSS